MQFVLVLIFVILFLFNSPVLQSMYPEIQNGYTRLLRLDAFADFWVLRSKVYEAMFFVALLIPLFKRTAHSYSLICATLMLIGGSVVDKWLNNFGSDIHDVYLYIGASFIYAIQLKKYRKRHP